MRQLLLIVVFAAACGSSPNQTGAVAPNDATSPISTTGGTGGGASRFFGDPHSGNFWLGPVDYSESQYHNACAPSVKYPAAIQSLYGNYIMGLANEAQLQNLTAGNGQLCDVCAQLAANGQSLVAHVVTYGDETGPNDIDVSPQIDGALDGASGRKLTWQFITCPTTAPITYTFDGRQWSNTWFFRVWVRNARVPVAKLEYQLAPSAWSTADWQSDGAWQASGADFSAGFSLRVTSIDNQTVVEAIPGLDTFDPNVGIVSQTNFQ